jgi:fumarylacetoacetase
MASSSLWKTVLEKVKTLPKHEDFSESHLPYGVAKRLEETFLCTRLHDFVIRLDGLKLSEPVLATDKSWNRLMQMSKPKRIIFRKSLVEQLFDSTKSPLFSDENFTKLVFPVWECQMLLPCVIGDYSDFYCSRQHAYNVGVMFRGKENALQPNWVHLPVGYHGRSSSVVQSPCKVVHPSGQLDEGKTYAPSRRLDFELEVGILIGGEENPMGVPLSVKQARERIFGYVLLNDWSARDVQTWEYVPLGPFCAKNFCTTISPWIIPAEALEPHLASPAYSPAQDPQPLPHLRDDQYLLPDVDLFVSIKPLAQVKESIICQSNFRNLYWTPAQMIAHHSSTGCNMRAGDLIGSGTISGNEPTSFGSMLELSWGGKNPITLSTGENRSFLQDGDTIRMYGRVKNAGIGFGDCSGIILPPLLGNAKL